MYFANFYFCAQIIIFNVEIFFLTDIFSMKLMLRDIRKEQQVKNLPQGGLMEGSGKVVLTAIAMLVNFNCT